MKTRIADIEFDAGQSQAELWWAEYMWWVQERGGPYYAHFEACEDAKE